jgi:hypothetical protein
MVSRIENFYKNLDKRFFAKMLLIVIPIICLWQISLFQYTMKFDMMDQYFPFRYFIGESISHGIIPWWNPYIYLGYPIHADPQSGFWYPCTWILGFNGYSLYDLHIEFLFHIILAGFGFYYLLRSLKIQLYPAIIFALSYQVGGFFIGNAQHFTYVIGACYIPWILGCFIQLIEKQEYRYGLALSLFLSLMLMGGYPSLIIILGYLLALYFLNEVFSQKLWENPSRLFKIISLLFISGILTIIISAGYLFSIIENQALITRGQGISPEQSLYMPFPPIALSSLIWPFLTAIKSTYIPSDISMTNIYSGLFTVILFPIGIIFSKWTNKYFWIIIGSICLFASFGEYAPVRLWIYHHIPLMNLFRFPSVFRIFFIVCLLIISAQGFQNYIEFKSVNRNRSIRFTITILILLSGIAFIWGIFNNGGFELFHIWDFSKPDIFEFSENFNTRLLFQSTIQCLFLALFFYIFYSTSEYRNILLLGIVILDLYAAAQLNISGTIISQTKFDSMATALQNSPKNFPNTQNQKLSELTTYKEEFHPSASNQSLFLKIITDDGYNPFQLKNFELFEKSTDRKKTMNHPVFYFSDSLQKMPTIIAMIPNYFEAKCDINKSDTLNLLQVYHPNWQLKIDDKPAVIYKKSNGLMAAIVAPHNHKIVFEYNTNYLKIMLWIQFMLQLSIIILIFKWTKKK